MDKKEEVVKPEDKTQNRRDFIKQVLSLAAAFMIILVMF
jgi:hypothetical protein